MITLITALIVSTTIFLIGDGQGAAATEEESSASAASTTEALPRATAAVSLHELNLPNETLAYTATAGVLPVHVEDRSSQEDRECRIFFVAYERSSEQPDERRPLAFVFNGGPGAASAYLHLGALGPRRVAFEPKQDGTAVRLVENTATWLTFTDLVFIDPIGTGYSRCVDGQLHGSEQPKSGGGRSDSVAWGVREDLDTMAAFLRLYLTRYERWLAPRFLVGESYGGFRAAALPGFLQRKANIGVNGVVLVSPVLQFSLLSQDPYRVLPWITAVPSYAATARVHEKASGELRSSQGPREFLREVEEFAVGQLLPALASGEGATLADQLSVYVGLPEEEIVRLRARIPASIFAKQLLRKRERILSLYDGSWTAVDPSPGRPLHKGEDPLLSHLNTVLTTAFNSYVRTALRFETDIPYELLNRTVSQNWNWRSGLDGSQGFVAVTDNLKEAMSNNPDLRVLITHGVFDLVTPYFGSVIVTRLMSLNEAIAPNLSLEVYEGGHMFYRREASRQAFHRDAREFFSDALSPTTDAGSTPEQ